MAKASERHGRVGLAAIGVGALLLASACTETQVTALAPRRAALPPDCPVQVFPGQPTYDYKPVATVRVSRCEAATFARPMVAFGVGAPVLPVAIGEDNCLSELRVAACRYGADTVFGLSEELSSVRMQRASFSGEETESTTTITYRATLAVRR